MTLKNNRTPLLSNIKLCASFHCHMWIQTGVTVRKRLSGVMTSVTLTFDKDLVSVNGNISGKFQDDTITGTLSKSVTDGRTDGRTDRRTDGQTERSVLGVAWSLLKTLLADNRYNSVNLTLVTPTLGSWIVEFCFAFVPANITHILQGYFTGNGTIIQLSQYM